MVNSRECRGLSGSWLRKQRQSWNRLPLPSASRRFIHSSGEGIRYSCGSPGNRAEHLQRALGDEGGGQQGRVHLQVAQAAEEQPDQVQDLAPAAQEGQALSRHDPSIATARRKVSILYPMQNPAPGDRISGFEVVSVPPAARVPRRRGCAAGTWPPAWTSSTWPATIRKTCSPSPSAPRRRTTAAWRTSWSTRCCAARAASRSRTRSSCCSSRSLQTFLNAFTFPDKTVYPAASQLEKDFFNLLAVYGDAVFFPRLAPEVFRQEGHRLELAADGSLSRVGVVYNEMKGSFSSAETIVADLSLRSLFPDGAVRPRIRGAARPHSRAHLRGPAGVPPPLLPPLQLPAVPVRRHPDGEDPGVPVQSTFPGGFRAASPPAAGHPARAALERPALRGNRLPGGAGKRGGRASPRSP